MSFASDLKKDIVVLNSLNISINKCTFDTMIAAYLLDYIVKNHVKKVLEEEVGVNVVFSGSSNATTTNLSSISSNNESDGGGGNVREYSTIHQVYYF